jgi:transcriptional regulator with XRE-family HTH domain
MTGQERFQEAVTMPAALIAALDMDFPERLSALRKERGLTQQALAERVGIHVSQLRRYEGGGAQPTLDVIRRLAIALSVSADQLVFDTDERGPTTDLRLHLEAIQHLDDDEKAVVRTVIESVLLRHEARRYAPAS